MSTNGIRIGLAKDKGHFLLVRGQRAASIGTQLVAEMLGLQEPSKIPMGEVRRIADLIFENPARYGGVLEYCPEQFDPDRKCAMDLFTVDEHGNVLPCPPLCGTCGGAMRQCEAPGGYYWACTPCDAKLEPPALPPPPQGQSDGYADQDTSDDWKGEAGG